MVNLFKSDNIVVKYEYISYSCHKKTIAHTFCFLNILFDLYALVMTMDVEKFTSFHEMFGHVSSKVCKEFHFFVEFLRVIAHRHVLLLALPIDVVHIPEKG